MSFIFPKDLIIQLFLQPLSSTANSRRAVLTVNSEKNGNLTMGGFPRYSEDRTVDLPDETSAIYCGHKAFTHIEILFHSLESVRLVSCLVIFIRRGKLVRYNWCHVQV